ARSRPLAGAYIADWQTQFRIRRSEHDISPFPRPGLTRPWLRHWSGPQKTRMREVLRTRRENWRNWLWSAHPTDRSQIDGVDCWPQANIILPPVTWTDPAKCSNESSMPPRPVPSEPEPCIGWARSG